MCKGHGMLSHTCCRMALALPDPVISSPCLFHFENIAMYGLYVWWAENRSERLSALQKRSTKPKQLPSYRAHLPTHIHIPDSAPYGLMGSPYDDDGSKCTSNASSQMPSSVVRIRTYHCYAFVSAYEILVLGPGESTMQ
jgi:hypothetical protein